MEICIDLDDLTLGEVEFFEETTGCSIDEIGNKNMTTKALLALVVIHQRRTNPEYTLDDARQVHVTDITFGDVNPTVEAGPAGS